MLTSSKGAQTKYKKGNYFYKINSGNKEGLAERLSSIILSETNIQDYVVYEECLINNKRGCRSKSFLKNNELFVSLQRLYSTYVGGELNDAIFPLTPRERIEYTLEFINEVTGLEAFDYLGKMLSFDAFILNTDRHFHNIGFTLNTKTREFKLAPVFDNGNSLLVDWTIYPPHYSIEECVEKTVGKPFYANLEMQAYLFNTPLRINYENLEKKLHNEPPSRQLETIHFQLEKYKQVFKETIKPALPTIEEQIANIQAKSNPKEKFNNKSDIIHEDILL